MSLRFRRSISIVPGIRLNVGMRGLSATLGPRGASINIGSRGVYGNVGLPGTGLSWRERLSAQPATTSVRESYRLTMKQVRELERSHQQASAQAEHAAAEAHLNQLRQIVVERCRDPYDWQTKWAPRGEFRPTPFEEPIPAFSLASSRQEAARQIPLGKWIACYALCAFVALAFGNTLTRVLSLAFVCLATAWIVSARKRRENFARLDFDSKSKEFRKDLVALKSDFEKAQVNATAIWSQEESARAGIRSAIERGDLPAIASVLETELQNESLPVPLVFELELESIEVAKVDVALPDLDDLPATLTNLTKRGKLSTRPMTQRDRTALFGDVCAGLCLRLLYEMFRVVPSLVHIEVFGTTTATDPATGHERSFVALHVNTTREAIASLDLDHIDPSSALAALGGVLSADRRGALTPIAGVTGLGPGGDASVTTNRP